MERQDTKKRIAVIGGGLAGLSAAAALCQRGMSVELFEAKQSLGGRAGSFMDLNSNELVDHCQHVGMECCTNLHDFFRETEIEEYFERHDLLHFFGPDGERVKFKSAWWLPAPLHLGPALLRMNYLTMGERVSIARAMLKLARVSPTEEQDSPTIGQWLHEQNQSERSIERFWSIVLVSALGETIERASLAAARKVFVDGFMAHRRAYHVNIPTIPLGELYEHIASWLKNRGVEIHLGRPAAELVGNHERISAVRFMDETSIDFDAFIIAVAWRRVTKLLPDFCISDDLRAATEFQSAPITGIHLWFDKPITDLPHAVFVDRLSQWMFNRGKVHFNESSNSAHYYQIVISASRDLVGRDRDEVLKEVLDDLASIWSATTDAKLLHWKMVTQRDAVFSFTPGLDRVRPAQRTSIDNLALAGDWTRTGWPSTMEGAVRSGRLAAQTILEKYGHQDQLVVDDLPRNWLVRWVCDHHGESK